MGGVLINLVCNKLKWVKGDPNFVPQFNKNNGTNKLVSPPEKSCLVQFFTLFFSHLLQVATVTWAPGHHPENAGVCVSTLTGDRRVVVPSPPQVKSVFTKDSPVWSKALERVKHGCHVKCFMKICWVSGLWGL